MIHSTFGIRRSRAFLFAVPVTLVGTLFCMMTLAGVNNARAQARPSSADNVISIDPLDLALLGPLNIQYEWKTSPDNSWALRGHFWGRSGWSGFGFGAAYRFYIADSRALTGLSVAPAADIYFFNESELNQTSTDVLIGGDLAYKWIFDQFAVEPILSLRIGLGSSTGFTYATGAVAGIGVYLGYAW